MYIHSMRKEIVRSRKVHDCTPLAVRRLVAALPAYGDGTNNILALLLCLPRGSAFQEATKLALAITAIRN